MSQVLPALVATLAAQMLVSMSVGSGPVLAPVAAGDIGVSAGLIGTYISLSYATAAAVGLVCGSFVARFGALRITQVALVLAAMGLCLGALSTPLATLLCAVLVGAANGQTTPSSSHVLSRVTPAQWRSAVFSTKQMGVPLGSALAGLMMPVLAVAFGWRAAVLAGAALCLLLAMAVQPWHARFDSDRAPGGRLLSFGQVVGPLRLVLQAPELRRLSIMSFVYSGMQNCFGAFLVTYLHDRLGIALVLAGLVLTVSQVAGAISRLIWGTLADRLMNPYRLLGGLGIGMSICALLTALFTPAWPFQAIVAVGIGFGATVTAWNGVFLAQIAVLAPAGRVGEATGGSQFCTFAGVTVMPATFSLVLALTDSYAVGFVVMAVLSCIAGLWLLKPAAAPRAP